MVRILVVSEASELVVGGDEGAVRGVCVCVCVCVCADYYSFLSISAELVAVGRAMGDGEGTIGKWDDLYQIIILHH